MTSLIRTAVAIVIALLAACTTPPSPVVPEPVAEPARTAAPASVAMPTTPSAPPDTVFEIELRRQGCFARCPNYRLRLSADGAVWFFGERFVAALGEQRGQVPSATVSALRDELRREPFASLNGRYTPDDPRCGLAASDAATTSITLRDGGAVRQIEHDLGCSDAPTSLRDLAAAIDSVSGSARWIDAPTE